MEQHRTMQSGPEQAGTKFLIFQVEQRSTRDIKHMEAIHFRRMREDLIKDADFLKHAHAGWLKQKSRSHGLAFGRALEHANLIPLAAQ